MMRVSEVSEGSGGTDPSECDEKMREYLQLRYQMVSEAYDYLLNAKEAPRARILGGEHVVSKEDNNRSRKERLEKEAKARRDKRYQELREEGKRLRQKTKYFSIYCKCSMESGSFCRP